MSINGIGGGSPVQRIINNPILKTLPTDGSPAGSRTGSTDKLELSGMSHLLKLAKDNDVRMDKVASVKAAIKDDTYESDDKLDVATDRLLDDLLK